MLQIGAKVDYKLSVTVKFYITIVFVCCIVVTIVTTCTIIKKLSWLQGNKYIVIITYDYSFNTSLISLTAY